MDYCVLGKYVPSVNTERSTLSGSALEEKWEGPSLPLMPFKLNHQVRGGRWGVSQK